MFIQFTCQCMADLQFEMDDAMANTGFLWAQKFIDQHEACGFMAPTKKDTQEETKRYQVIKEIKRKEKDE
jgi:hypothetical protein